MATLNYNGPFECVRIIAPNGTWITCEKDDTCEVSDEDLASELVARGEFTE